MTARAWANRGKKALHDMMLTKGDGFGIGSRVEIRILRIRYLPWTLAVGNSSYSQAGYGGRDRARSAVALLPRTVGR